MRLWSGHQSMRQARNQRAVRWRLVDRGQKGYTLKVALHSWQMEDFDGGSMILQQAHGCSAVEVSSCHAGRIMIAAKMAEVMPEAIQRSMGWSQDIRHFENEQGA